MSCQITIRLNFLENFLSVDWRQIHEFTHTPSWQKETSNKSLSSGNQHTLQFLSEETWLTFQQYLTLQRYSLFLSLSEYMKKKKTLTLSSVWMHFHFFLNINFSLNFFQIHFYFSFFNEIFLLYFSSVFFLQKPPSLTYAIDIFKTFFLFVFSFCFS